MVSDTNISPSIDGGARGLIGFTGIQYMKQLIL